MSRMLQPCADPTKRPAWLAWIGLMIGLLLLAPAPPAAAQCAPRLEVTLADGSKVCLSSYAVADKRAPGGLASVARASNASATYALAVPAMPARCPAVVGWSNWVGSQLLQLGYLPNETNPSFEERRRKAIESCSAALRDAAAPADCQCVELVMDGRSRLDRATFEQLASFQGAPALVAQREQREPPAATAPPAKPAATPPAAPMPSASAGDTPGATRDELRLLQAQLAELRQQVGRQPAPPVVPKPAVRARALVIGNGLYAHLGKLPNPPNDARAMADKFRRMGIEVDLVLDADRAGLVKALGEFQSRAAGHDLNILFYAGHGLQVDGVNYVIPLEMAVNGATAGSVKLNAISLTDALEYLPAKTRLVFLDACRDNPLSRSLRGSRSGVSAGLAPVNTVTGTLVAYATKDGSTAEDGVGRNSPYTEALLKHLDADADISIVLRRVRQAVLDATSGRQEPWEYGSLVGDQLILSRLNPP